MFYFRFFKLKGSTLGHECGRYLVEQFTFKRSKEVAQVRDYAARKGTREKARNKKIKSELNKMNYLEKIQLSKKITIIKPDSLLYPQSNKVSAQDNVYFTKYYRWKIYTFAEAIQCHREYFHPTAYSAQNSLLHIYVELDMQGAKINKPIESFDSIVPIEYQFNKKEDRRILVFCKSETEVQQALKGGASLAGGADIVKSIVNGEISVHNYDTIIAHPAVMPEILTIRGLLKKKFPTIKTGTLGVNLQSLLQTQLYGITYTATPYMNFPNYGFTKIPIGMLNMDIEHLEDNLKRSVESIVSCKSNKSGGFITRIRIECPPSKERFQIDHKLYTHEGVINGENKMIGIE